MLHNFSPEIYIAYFWVITIDDLPKEITTSVDKIGASIIWMMSSMERQ